MVEHLLTSQRAWWISEMLSLKLRCPSSAFLTLNDLEKPRNLQTHFDSPRGVSQTSSKCP